MSITELHLRFENREDLNLAEAAIDYEGFYFYEAEHDYLTLVFPVDGQDDADALEMHVTEILDKKRIDYKYFESVE